MMPRLSKAIDVFGAFLLFALMMLTVVDVFGRSVLNRPLPGADELTELALGCVVFLLLPKISLQRRHIAVDLVARKSGRSLRSALDLLGAATGFVVFALIGWRLWHLAVTASGYNDSTATLGIPIAPALYLFAVLAIVNAFAFLATIPAALRPVETSNASAPPDSGSNV